MVYIITHVRKNQLKLCVVTFLDLYSVHVGSRAWFESPWSDLLRSSGEVLQLSLSREVKVGNVTNKTDFFNKPKLHLKIMLSKWELLFSSSHYIYSSTIHLSVNHVEPKQRQVLTQYFSLVSIVHYRLHLRFKKWLVVSSGTWLWILFKGAWSH